MTEQHRKLSRRDALKILGAATGATVLASLPAKWSTPEIASGVLPVHVQTSVVTTPVYTLSCSRVQPGPGPISSITALASISPVAQGISLHYQADLTGNGAFTSPAAGASISGDIPTDINGEVPVPYCFYPKSDLFDSCVDICKSIQWN